MFFRWRTRQAVAMEEAGTVVMAEVVMVVIQGEAMEAVEEIVGEEAMAEEAEAGVMEAVEAGVHSDDTNLAAIQ